MIIGLDANFLSGDFPASWTTQSSGFSLSYNNLSSFPASCSPGSSSPACGPNRLVSTPTVILTKVSGDGQWAQAGNAFANPLVVAVADLSNNPVSGATVTFSGPGINTTTAMTGGNGMASAAVTASSTVGGNTVTAAVGLTGMTTFGLTVGDQPACGGSISVTGNADTGPGTLREALANVCPGGTVDLTPIAGQTIALSANVDSYNFSGRLYIGDDVTILGHGATISGSGNTRIFFIQGGNVNLTNLSLTDGLGEGGSSQFGGPAAGMGGAIFQNGGNLTLSNIIFSNNTAQGGTTDGSGDINGGGFGANSSGGDLGGGNGAGDGAGGLLDGAGDPGGFGGGGGMGNAVDSVRGGPLGVLGGVGGFGGSMGSTAALSNPSAPTQILQNSNNPFANGYGAVLGGGAGFGGAIFTRAGTLTLTDDTFSGNSAVGASGAQGKGGSLFVYASGGATATAANVVFSGSVAAAAGTPGVGYSDLTYVAGNTCPTEDDANICGTLRQVSFTGPSSAMYGNTITTTTSDNANAAATITLLSGPCSSSGGIITVTGANGTCVLEAAWPASGSYAAASAEIQVNTTALPVTASIVANNKAYNGTAAATIASCSLSGVLAADMGAVGCAATSASFASAGPGSGIQVTASGITLTGSAAANYALRSTTATATASITPANVTAAVTITSTALSYNRPKATGTETLTIRNNTASAIAGPLEIALAISGNAAASGNTGTYQSKPYWTVQAGPLAPGASASVSVTFQYAAGTAFTTAPTVYSGSLQ